MVAVLDIECDRPPRIIRHKNERCLVIMRHKEVLYFKLDEITSAEREIEPGESCLLREVPPFELRQGRRDYPGYAEKPGQCPEDASRRQRNATAQDARPIVNQVIEHGDDGISCAQSNSP